MSNTKRVFTVITAVALSFSLAACGGGSDNDKADDTKTADATQTEAAPTDDTQKDEAPSGEVKNKDTAGDGVPFGDTYEYEDGLKVTFGKLEKYDPSPQVAEQLPDQPVRYKVHVTLDNGSDKELELTMYGVTAKVGDKTSGMTFGDPEGNLGIIPVGTFAPGDSKSADIGLAVADEGPVELKFQIIGDDNREDVVFKQ